MRNGDADCSEWAEILPVRGIPVPATREGLPVEGYRDHVLLMSSHSTAKWLVMGLWGESGSCAGHFTDPDPGTAQGACTAPHHTDVPPAALPKASKQSAPERPPGTATHEQVCVLTFDVRVYKLRIRACRRRSFVVRWRAAGRDHSEGCQFEAQG